MRRPLKITLWSLSSLASLLLLAVGFVLVAGNTDAGRRAIEKLTASLTGGLVKIQGLDGSFPTHLSLSHLELTDARGVWLTADQIILDWSPLRYFSKGLAIDNVQAGRVDMERLPQSKEPSTPSKPPSMPHIQVAKFACPEVKLGAELVGVPASLNVSGSADLQSLTEMLFDANAKRTDGDGNYLAHLHFDSEHMQAMFKVHEPANGPLEHILGLPGLGALDADASLSGPRSHESVKLALTAGDLKGHAEGFLDLKELAADLRFDLDSANLQPRDDLHWSHAAVHGVWQGSLKALNADAHVELADLLAPGDVRLKSLAADFTARQGQANLKARVEGLEIPGSAPRLLAGDPIAINAGIRFDQPRWPVEITANHRLFALSGRAEAAKNPSAQAELRILDLGPFGALAGQEVRGGALINARMTSKDTETRIAADANLQLKPGSQAWAGMVGDKAALQLTALITDKLMTLETFKLNGRALSVSLNGSLSRGTAPQLHARFNADVSDMSTLASTLAGKLSASGSVQGGLDDLKAGIEANSDLAVRGSPPGRIKATISIDGLPRTPRGSILAEGDLDGAPLHADLGLERAAPGELHTVIHALNWKSAQAAGDITTATASQTSRGHLEASLGNLADLEHLIGSKVEGGALIKLDLIPEHDRTRMQLDVEGHDLKIGTLAGTVRLSGTGMTDAFPFQLEMKMPAFRGAAATLSSDGTLNLDGHELTVAHLLANYRGQDVKLKAPARFLYVNGVSVDVFKLGDKEAELEVQGQIYPDASLRIALSKVYPDLVNAFMPDLLAAGSIEAHAELHGALSSPTGQLDVHANGVRSAQGVALDLPAGNLRANAQLSGDTAQLDVALDAGSDSHLTITGTVPIAAHGAIDAKINGKVSMTLVNPLLEARGQHAEGTLGIDANVTGTLDDPDIGGGAQLADGSVRDYVRGISLTNIEAKLTGTKGKLEIETLKASAAPGTINASGSIGVLEPDMPVDIKITAKDAQPVVSKLITANMNADIKIEGTLRQHMSIAGNLHLNRALIGIPNSLPPNVAVLDVRRRGKAAPPPPDKPLIIDLDLGIQAPRQVLVQGRGLDAEMGGDMHIAGTTDAPQVSGRFDLQRGNFSIASSKLTFSQESNISFNGAGLRNKLDPTLNFIATTTVNRGTAGTSHITLAITGFADAPQFALTSDDSLPQDEIMAALLFGTNEQSLSALQVAQVGMALASLSGVGGGGGINPLAKIQKSLGLDRLSFGAGATTAAPGGGTENSGASIEAGRYISKRVYIEAKQSTTGTSQVQADVDLTKRLKLQTKLGNGTASVQGTTPDNDPGSSIGLLYQFEY